MKLNKLIALLLAAAMLFAFVGCPSGNEPETPDNQGSDTPATPAEDSLKDVADIKDGLVELTPAVEAVGTEGEEGYVAAVPATYVKEYKITDVEGLKKLAEIVNGKAAVEAVGTEGEEGYVPAVAAVPANPLAGYTFTVANDITINEKVLTDDFKEPAEKAPGEATEGLVNLDSIGTGKTVPFSGTFDGNNKVISGFYAYQGHWGLGFLGNIKDATVKNVILRDACVINMNIKGGDDDDDDRFGGLIGLSMGGNTIENCIFEGVVGSEVASTRDAKAYEYIGGLIGRNDGTSTAKDCTVLARVYGSADVITKHNADKVTKENVVGFDAATDLEAGKAAIDAAVEAARK